MSEDERDHIVSCLDDAGVSYELYSHGHIHTSEEAAEERDHDLDETVKSLVLEADGEHILYAVPGDRLVDFDGVADALGANSVSLGDPEEVEAVTGCEVGSVPPFGPCLGIESYVDEAVFDKDVVHASIGTHTDSVKVSTAVFEDLDFTRLRCSYEKE
jgi:Ala-tRNA(Pro) deacylase